MATLKESKVQTIIDSNTGEVLEVETSKTFVQKLETEEFYMVIVKYIAPFFQLQSVIAMKLLVWLCVNATFNTGKVSLSSDTRTEICKYLGISNSALSQALKKLKDVHLISGNTDIIINPFVFWKGNRKSREELLKDNEIEIMFTLK